MEKMRRLYVHYARESVFKMKLNKPIVLCLLLSSRMVFAESNLRTLFDFREYPSKEIAIKDSGIFESQQIKDSDYSACWIFSIEKLKGIDTFLYYPPSHNEVHKFMGKFEINNQEFTFMSGDFWLPSLALRSVDFKDRTFLLFLGDIGKYSDKICFVFDITNPDRIVFYPPDNRFVEADFGNKFFGLYQDKFCFFFSTRRFEWNGQYRLCPYVIDGVSLRRLCDENGNPYFVDYLYITKYEQEFTIEEKNIPDNMIEETCAGDNIFWKLVTTRTTSKE